MLNEKNPLLKLELKKKKIIILKLIKNIFECFYLLFDSLLENPLENIWYASFSIILEYFQLIFYIFDVTVSLFILL